MFELLEAYALRTPLFYLKECALGLCDGQDNANLLKEGSELITIDRPAILNIGSSETITKLGFRVKRFPQLGKPGGSPSAGNNICDADTAHKAPYEQIDGAILGHFERTNDKIQAAAAPDELEEEGILANVGLDGLRLRDVTGPALTLEEDYEETEKDEINIDDG